MNHSLTPTQQRAARIEELQRHPFDLVVIGGGITGAAIARDAALRGLKTALLERQDFASGASGKSARLVHGGVRYIESGQFGTVYHACAERHTLDVIAPHLLTPMPFTLPLYEKPSRYWKARLGLWLYDWLALFRNVERNQPLRKEQVAQLEPALTQHQLMGAMRYIERATDDARLTLCTVLCGQHWGSLPLNYAEVQSLLKHNGRVTGVAVRDQLSGQEFAVTTKLVVNATGAWSDLVRKQDGGQGSPSVRPNKGIHVIAPRQRLPLQHAVIFPAADDKRSMYAVPWRNTVIIGTTDTDYTGDLDHVCAVRDEVAWILQAVNRCFPNAALVPTDLISSYAGLRPLVNSAEQSAYRAARDHQISVSPTGLISIVGGKLTTHRAMATDVVDRVARQLGNSLHCRTAQTPLYGWRSPTAGRAGQPELADAAACLDPLTIQHLLSTYSAEAQAVWQLACQDSALQQPIVAGLPYIYAEVVYALHFEMPCTLNDVLIRRLHLIHEDSQQGLAHAAPIAQRMATHLQWSAEETARQISLYQQEVALTRQFQA